MSDRIESPWLKSKAANDNENLTDKDRGNQTQARAVICDLPSNPGIIDGEVDLVARYFHLIVGELEAANDNETIGES